MKVFSKLLMLVAALAIVFLIASCPEEPKTEPDDTTTTNDGGTTSSSTTTSSITTTSTDAGGASYTPYSYNISGKDFYLIGDVYGSWNWDNVTASADLFKGTRVNNATYLVPSITNANVVVSEVSPKVTGDFVMVVASDDRAFDEIIFVNVPGAGSDLLITSSDVTYDLFTDTNTKFYTLKHLSDDSPVTTDDITDDSEGGDTYYAEELNNSSIGLAYNNDRWEWNDIELAFLNGDEGTVHYESNPADYEVEDLVIVNLKLLTYPKETKARKDLTAYKGPNGVIFYIVTNDEANVFDAGRNNINLQNGSLIYGWKTSRNTTDAFDNTILTTGTGAITGYEYTDLSFDVIDGLRGGNVISVTSLGSGPFNKVVSKTLSYIVFDNVPPISATVTTDGDFKIASKAVTDNGWASIATGWTETIGIASTDTAYLYGPTADTTLDLATTTDDIVRLVPDLKNATGDHVGVLKTKSFGGGGANIKTVGILNAKSFGYVIIVSGDVIGSGLIKTPSGGTGGDPAKTYVNATNTGEGPRPQFTIYGYLKK